MNQKQTLLFVICSLVVLSPVLTAQEKNEKNQPDMVLTVYPDPLYTELQEVVKKLAEEIELNVKIKHKSYADSRQLVIDRTADGMLITRRMNRIRLKKANARKGKIQKPKIKKFIPLARKIIRSKDKILDEVILGIAYTKHTPGLQKLANLARSENAEEIFKNLSYIAPLK